jgi:hypothetical protein
MELRDHHKLSSADINSLNAGKYLKQEPLGCSRAQHPSKHVVTKQSNTVLKLMEVILVKNDVETRPPKFQNLFRNIRSTYGCPTGLPGFQNQRSLILQDSDMLACWI